jgi:hypothetical protein
MEIQLRRHIIIRRTIHRLYYSVLSYLPSISEQHLRAQQLFYTSCDLRQ